MSFQAGDTIKYGFSTTVTESFASGKLDTTFETVVEAQSYDDARSQFESEVKSEFGSVDSDAIGPTKIRFADAPWDSGEELKQLITGLPSVRSARYEDPMDGSYGPPRYHLRTNGPVQKEVNDLYPGLTVKKDSGGSAVVVISPLAT